MDFVSSITLAFKDAFSSGFTDAQNSMAGMRSSLDEINRNQSMNRLAADMAMMTGMTEPMRRALSDAMDKPSQIAGTLDSAFRTIQVGMGASAEEMAAVRRELLAIGGRAAAGPEAVAGAFANIATGVSDASKRMSIMNAAVSLAEANQADLAMSTNAMINVMNAWNLSADNAAVAADVLTQASYMGVGSLDDFAGSISHISALAAGTGIGLDELGASMAYVTTKGMSASQAQKQFKGIISTLSSPSENLSKLYNALGVESGEAMLRQYGLAESLNILKDALGGDEQAFAGIIGSAEAATVALALTEDQYVSFAGSFAEGMGTVTEAARGVQLESIEMKMARLQSASDSLQAQIGQDINGIKGFFIDMKFGFLSNVVSPLMGSPAGGAISKLAAFAGMGAKGFLDMGSGALAAASQLTTLTANISNAGGIAKLFHSSIGMVGSGLKILGAPLRVAGGGLAAFGSSMKNVGVGFLKTFQTGLTGIGHGFAGLGKSIIGALPKMGAWIASMWSAAAAHLAAFWPVYAIIGGVAALAAGVYLLIKNWGAVSGFFTGLWGKIKGAFSAAWDWITKLIFGASDWILGAIAVFMPFIGIPALIIKHWDSIKAFFSGLWTRITGAFSDAWDRIKNLLFGTSDWILGAAAVFMPIVGIPALIIKHWDAIKTFFSNLFTDPKAAIQGFIDWIGGKVQALIAPFKMIGGVAGGIFSGIAGFFNGGGKESGAALNDAFAGGITSNASAPAAAFGNSLQGVARQMPHSDAPEGPLSAITSSGRALTDTFASGMDEAPLREKASAVFSAAVPEGETALEFPSGEGRPPRGGGPPAVHIQNLYLQADDCQSLLDFVRVIMQSVNRPQEAPV